MTVELGFEMTASYPVTLNVDEDTLPKNWNEMTAEEKEHYIIRNFSADARRIAEEESGYSLGWVEYLEIQD